jgi:hypothetical protein
LWTICLDWVRILILLISWVARITGVNHQCPASTSFWWIEPLISVIFKISSNTFFL